MAYKDPLASTSSSSPSNDPLKSEAEDENEISQLEAGLNGIASGIIKIPEGFASLGAEIMDATGMTANAAAKVEQAFDYINPFEEIAEQRAAGKIIEALIQIGVPAGAGAKIASKLATKALKARKAGTYVNLKGKNLRKGMEKVYKLNDKARVKRFGAAVLGGAAGETLVADVENIGTIGDALNFGPSQLNVNKEIDFEGAEVEDPQKDAVRKLFNRAKFGADSIMYFPIIYGAGKFIGTTAKYGKDLVLSSSKINKTIDKVASAVRPTSSKPEALFLGKNAEQAGISADSNFAMEQVKRIDKEVSKMYPSVKSFFLRNGPKNKQNQESFYKDLKELMFEGDLNNKLGNTKTFKKIKKEMSNSGLNSKSQNIILDGVYNSRQKMASLLETVKEGSTAGVTLPKDLAKMPGLMGDRVKTMLGGTYKIFQNPVVDNLSAYKPAEESINKVKEILKRNAAKNGRQLTEDELDYGINEILTSATKMTKGTQLPSFKMTNMTMGATTPDIRKSFLQTLSKKQKNGEPVTQIVGKGSKAFRELFGEVDDARESIYNGIGLLSTIAKRSEFLEGLLKKNDEAIANKTTQLFYSDKTQAIKNLGAGGLNKIVSLDETLAPLFKDGILVNRLKGMYTNKETADAFEAVNKISDMFVGQKETVFGKGLSWAYKNLILTPKAGAQIAKTVLSPTTHARNFLSATGFSLANGTLFVNPKLFAEAAASAGRSVQFGVRSPKGMAEYREALELGVVNTNAKMGDFQSLLKDIDLDPNSAYTNSMFKGLLKKMSRLTEPAQALYTLEDDVFKMYNFKVETTRLGEAYAKAGIKKTSRELKEEAADIVRNTVPNYAYVSDVVKSMRSTPFSNFASFPAAIVTSAAGIGARMSKEMRHSKPTKGSNLLPMVYEVGKGLVKNDNPLHGIGMKRLVGAASAFGTLGVGIQKGYQAIQGTTDSQQEALERWVAPYEVDDKKLISKEEQPDGTNKYFYQNWSANNAYDYLESPFRTLLNKVQEGIETDEQLMPGFVKGLSDAFKRSIEPFITESIAPEAIFDIVMRGGETREGRKLYTEGTPFPDQVRIATKHILKTQIPFSQSQLSRIYYAGQGIPDPRGNEFQLENELPGLLGWRLQEINPIKGLSFKITGYDVKKRNATREFTGGDSRLLSGGKKDPKEIIRQLFIANKALFEAQQEFHLDLKAANQFEVTDEEMSSVFVDRGVPSSTYGPLFGGEFKPYIPSGNILNKFFSISQSTGVNPMEEALPVIKEMIQAIQGAPLNEPFRFKLEDFGIEEEQKPFVDPLSQVPLQETPSIDTSMLQQNNPSVTQSGLTPTEEALYSKEEQLITLRNRGIA